VQPSLTNYVGKSIGAKPLASRNPILLGRRVQARVGAELADRGFNTEKSADHWVRRRTGDIQDWISLPLDLTAGEGPICVTANLGIYLPRLEACFATHPEFDARAHWAGFTVNIGLLLPDRTWRQWPIAADEAFDWSLGGFVSALIDVGLPWLAQFQDAATLREAFETFGHADGRDAIARALNELEDDVQDAMEAVWSREGFSRTTHIHPPHPRRPRPNALSAGSVDPLWHCDD
jgi:hypothetical protein